MLSAATSIPDAVPLADPIVSLSPKTPLHSPPQGTSSQRPATKGSKSSKGTKPYKGARPSKILDEQSIVNKRLKGASTSRCLQNRNLYQPGAYNAGYESESDNEDEYESSATNAAGNFTIPAGHYTLAQALEGQAAQVLGEALSRAASMVLEGEGMGEEGVMVEVGVGAASGATPKLSDAESGWSSSNGSRRSSVAGMLESVSQRALHVVTHTVPKKARRLTEAMVGLGDDLSQAADAAADRLRASSVKFATKVEKTFDRAQAKVEKAGGKIKGWCKQVGTGFKSLLVCGASNLPVA
jgi:hypothetical protein